MILLKNTTSRNGPQILFCTIVFQCVGRIGRAVKSCTEDWNLLYNGHETSKYQENQISLPK